MRSLPINLPNLAPRGLRQNKETAYSNIYPFRVLPPIRCRVNNGPISMGIDLRPKLGTWYPASQVPFAIC